MDPSSLANHLPVLVRSSRVTPVFDDPRDSPVSQGRLNLEVEDMEMGYTDEKEGVPDFVVQSKDMLEMDLEGYGFWLEEIGNGDLSKIDLRLKKVDPFERHKLICGKFIFPNEEVMHVTYSPVVAKQLMRSYASKQKAADQKLICSTPLVAALAGGHMELAFKLIKMGSDIFGTAMYSWNCLHVLVILCVSSPTSKIAVRRFQMMKDFILNSPKLGEPSLRKLLMAEDDSGYRPLELASRVGALDMANEIWNIEGVYRFTQVRTGVNNIAYYDVTEYTNDGKRINNNPLSLLYGLTYERLDQLAHSLSFLSTPLGRWMENYCKTYRWFRRGWMLYRFLYVVSFLVFFQDFLVVTFYELKHNAMRKQFHNQTPDSNMSRDEFHFDCDMKSFTSFSCRSLFYIIMPLVTFRLLTTISGHLSDFTWYGITLRKTAMQIMADENGQRSISSCGFYLKCDCFHIVCATVVITSLYSVQMSDCATRTFIFICIAMTSICNVWSCLYFLRLNSTIGYFVVTFQEMIGNMVNFLVIQFLIILSFAITFFAIIGSQCMHSGFDTFCQSIYTTFITMLNMVTFTNEIDISTPEGIVVVILHIIYVLVVAILLLNFLIAVMSDTVNQVSKYKAIVNLFQIMFVSQTIAARMRFLTKKCDLFQSQYVRKMDKRYFVATYHGQCSDTK